MGHSQQPPASDHPAHASAHVNGVELHYAHAGAGPLIVFLHGFPQSWYQFRHQLAEFSRDHLAVAPDLVNARIREHLARVGAATARAA